MEDTSQTIARYLQSELAEVQVRRPEYSLRAFARRLNVTPAHLSLMIRGNRRVTRTIAERIFQNLGTSESIAGPLLKTLPDKPAKLKEMSPADKILASYTQVSDDQFRMISDWYYFAIMCLAATPDFVGKADFISRRLGISIREAETALELLLQQGYLVRTRRGRIVTTGKNFTAVAEVPSVARKKHQVQGIELARQALDLPMEFRLSRSHTMCLDPKDVPRLIKSLEATMATFMKKATTGKSLEVYRYNVQFFPLSKMDFNKYKGSEK